MADEAIDQSWMIEEMVRIIESFEYFLDHYVWIEDKASKTPIKLELWPAQRDKIQDLFKHRLIIILKAHQLGYTWLFVAAYCLWRAMTESMHHIVVNSFNEDVGIEILNRVDFILDRLPPWLQPEIGKSNTQLKEFIHRDPETYVKQLSIIQVIPATEKGAQSKTPTILIVDESAQNRYVGKTYTASKPGIDMAQGQIIIISNAIKDAPGWPFTRKLYTESMKGLNTFHRIFLPWQANPQRPANFKQIQLQEGMDDDDFTQRYPETEAEAISIMGGSYFGKALNRHQDTVDGIVGRLERDNFKDLVFTPQKREILEIWRYPYNLVSNWDKIYWTNRYAIGSDVSEGLGQSYSVAYVLDRLHDEIVARLENSNKIDAYQWANLLYELSQYYSNALLCVERTGAGQTTVKRLKELNANQYVRLILDKVGNPVGKELGWNETEQSKHELCGDLKQWLKQMRGQMYCSVLIDECSTWIKHEGSRRIGPEEGHFGDCVIAGGCTIQASISLGGAPKPIKTIDEGWRESRNKKGKSAWTK